MAAGGAGGIRAGQCFVEIHANDTAFQRGMVRISQRLQVIGGALRNFGMTLGMGVGAVGVPMIAAARATATFQDALLELQAATADLTPEQFRAVHDEALRLSTAMGVAPERVAQAFAHLIKAGMSVDDALGGAARAAVEFAHISQIDAEAAALFMKSAMFVFGVSAREAADTLSAAADSSSTSIAEMVQAFSLIGSAGGAFNQSLFGIAQSMAFLSNYLIKGEEAGTGLKTFLVKLISPSKEADKALAKYGLTVRSFRNEAGKMLSIGQIADILREHMAKFGDEINNDKMLVDVFGDRGVKVMAAFAKGGKQAFDEVGRAMQQSRSVTEKFNLMMGGLSGSFERLMTAVKLLSIGFGETLTHSLRGTTEWLVRAADAARRFMESNPGISQWAAGGTVAAAGLSILAVVLGFLATGLARVSALAVRFSRWLFNPMGAGMMSRWALYATRLATAFGIMRNAIAGLGIMVASGGPLAVLGAILATGLGGFTIGRLLASLFGIGAARRPTVPNLRARENPPAETTPDEFQKPMGGPIGTGELGANRGTFFAAFARQMGIGPQTSAAERTAAATERTADAVEQIADQSADDDQGDISAIAAKLRSPSGDMVNSTLNHNLSPKDFRDASGSLLPADEIVQVLNERFGKLDAPSRDKAITDIFGDRGVKVLSSLLTKKTPAPVVNVAERSVKPSVPNATAFQRAMRSVMPAVGRGLESSDRELVDATEETAVAVKRTNQLLQKLVDMASNGGIAFA